MRFKTTTKLAQVQKWVPIFKKLELPNDVVQNLSDGRVFYVVWDHGFSCWPYFPISRRRRVVKDFEDAGIQVPTGTKVIVEINPKTVIKAEVQDCLGHTFLYLIDAKARNECKDALRTWKLMMV